MALELKVLLNVEFHRAPTRYGERRLVMDLWLPQGQPKPMPLIVYVHGGGWRMGTQYRPPFQPRLFDEGVATVAITYRFSGEAPFPAMLHDCKTAVRWLRAHAAQFNLDPDRFATWGISAGGHLSGLLGVTNGRAEFDGDGPYREYRSDVCAVCSWCGPMDLAREYESEDPANALATMVREVVGGTGSAHAELARAASPVAHALASSAPFLLVHGAEDTLVPAWHSTAMHERLRNVGAHSELVLLPGIGHAIDQHEAVEAVRRFFVEQFELAG
jgi:acetyl esterase/lipase